MSERVIITMMVFLAGAVFPLLMTLHTGTAEYLAARMRRR